jgi:large subunit ribosomal protein L35
LLGEHIVAKKVKKYKLKTHKATSKRFRMTGSGKIVRTKGGKSHLRRRTPRATKAMFTKMIEVTTTGEKRRIRRLMPYMRLYKSNPPAGR